MFLEPAARHRRVEADRPVRATMVKPRSAGTRSASNICPVRQVAAGAPMLTAGVGRGCYPGCGLRAGPVGCVWPAAGSVESAGPKGFCSRLASSL